MSSVSGLALTEGWQTPALEYDSVLWAQVFVQTRILVAKLKSATVSHISGLGMKLKYLVTNETLTYFLLEPWLI